MCTGALVTMCNSGVVLHCGALVQQHCTPGGNAAAKECSFPGLSRKASGSQDRQPSVMLSVSSRLQASALWEARQYKCVLHQTP